MIKMDLLSNVESATKDGSITSFDEKEVEEWMDKEDEDDENWLALIYGVDGTMKTGMLMEYLAKSNYKKVFYLDIDGNSRRIKKKFHPDANIIIKRPIETTLDEVKGKMTARIDYERTLEKIKIALHIAASKRKYDAVVIDGASTLLEYAKYQTKIDKHIDADGKVSLQFWEKRKIHFMGVIELLRAIEGVDKFIIGHDDFINIPGTKKVQMGQETIELNKTSKPVFETNRAMDQRIYCELEINSKGNEVYWATIHKWRDGADFVNEKIKLGEKVDGVFKFYSKNIMGIFEGKNVHEEIE